mgnify:CR=1 FL=1
MKYIVMQEKDRERDFGEASIKHFYKHTYTYAKQ